MEVKVGVVDNPRELTIASPQTPDEVESLVADALAQTDGRLSLSDEKGRRYIVPTARIAYVEIGPEETTRVGFGVG